MREWIMGITGYLLLVNAAKQMLPGKTYEHYFRLFAGLLLILMVLQPVLKIRSADSLLETQILEFVKEQERLEEEVLSRSSQFSDSIKQQEREEENAEEISEIEVEVPEIEKIEQIQVEVSGNDKKAE